MQKSRQERKCDINEDESRTSSHCILRLVTGFDMLRLSATLTALLIACQSVICYESVYDIIERQNQRRYFRRPGNGYPETRDIYFDGYPTFSGKSDSIRPPVRYDRFGFQGIGYDNIGNGNVRLRERLHFFPEEMPYQRRYRGGFDRVYQREFPVFHKYYYLRPHYDERSFDNDRIKGGGLYHEKGSSDVHKIDSLIANNEGNNQRNLLENFRDNKVSTLSDARRKENFGEMSHSDRINENKSTIRSNRVSKKGHVTKGFSTHHHKDETGNSTTFYDEFSDHGGQDDYKDVADGFGTKTTSEHFSNVEDGKFFNENGGQSGNYGAGSVADTRKTEKNYVLNDNRFDHDERFRLEDGKDRRNLYDTGYAPDHLHFSNYNYY